LRRGHANLLCIVPILTSVPKNIGGGFDRNITRSTFFHFRLWANSDDVLNIPTKYAQ
jgi:hypothetical protein